MTSSACGRVIDLLAKAPRDLTEINRRIVALVEASTNGVRDDLTILALEACPD